MSDLSQTPDPSLAAEILLKRANHSIAQTRARSASRLQVSGGALLIMGEGLFMFND